MSRLGSVMTAGAAMVLAPYAGFVATNWLRYGRGKPAHGLDHDPALDNFMPRFEIVERHSTTLAPPPDIVMAAARSLAFEDVPLVRAIFKAREIAMRSRPSTSPPPRGLFEQTKALGWGVLLDEPHELIMGAATKPWEANPVFRPIPADQFASFAEPGHVKIVWTLRVAPSPNGTTFHTETRAIATDPEARRRFRRYWSLVSPGIILIRRLMLSPLATASDRAWQLEGDDLLPDARAQFTDAITIGAPPAQVWPWLVQMGCQRAGWYSWDFLDNGGKPSADRIIPELQHLAVGDLLPARPTGPDGFEVLRMIPDRALVLAGIDPQITGTWAFILEPAGTGTRLISRYRAAYAPSPKMSVMLAVMRRVHAFMEHKQLRTIKHHAEQLH